MPDLYCLSNYFHILSKIKFRISKYSNTFIFTVQLASFPIWNSSFILNNVALSCASIIYFFLHCSSAYSSKEYILFVGCTYSITVYISCKNLAIVTRIFRWNNFNFLFYTLFIISLHRKHSFFTFSNYYININKSCYTFCLCFFIIFLDRIYPIPSLFYY